MIEGERSFRPEHEEPEAMYHASPRRGITRLEPRARTYRHPEEGGVVFATPDRAYATMFLVESDDSWVHMCTFDGVHCMVISDRQRFAEVDHGGSLYSLPPESFSNSEAPRSSDRELVSKEAVAVSAEHEYASALEAMVEHDVQVYFVDSVTFAAVQTADDYGLRILRGLESENQKRRMHVRELPSENAT